MTFEHRGELRADPGTAPGERNMESRSQRRSIWPSIAVAAAALAFCGVIWYAYQSSHNAARPGPPPIVRAEQGPIKVKPDQPGGQQIPFQDSTVYDRLNPNGARAPVEKLLPPPEAPAARPVAPSKLADSANPPSPDASSPTALAPAPGVSLERPAPVRVPPESSPKPATLTPKAESSKTDAARPAAVVPPAAVAAAAPSARPGKAGGYRIQVSAVRSADAVDPEWQRLKRRFPETLGQLRLSTGKAEVAGKGTFYRIQAGPLDESGAKSACQHLKGRGVGCIVVKS